MIQIPFGGTAASTEPLRRCIKRAASDMGVSEFHAAMLMSHFCEQVCCEVAMNRLVSVPGFGVFGPKVWTPRHDPDEPGYCYPAFSAAVPFRNMVRAMCPPSGAALDAIDRRRRHSHPSSRRDRTARNPCSAQRAFRERIRAQARRLGMEV